MTRPVLSRRMIFLGTSVAAAIAVSAAFAQETVTFPSRSSDLAGDSYWTVAEFSEGCCTMDFNVRRWNGSRWAGGTGSAQNNQDYDWNLPLYAPANGVIASCWRNFPDDPTPSGSQPPRNDEIFTGGNHVVIITDGGNAISHAHLKAGTIPAGLCPGNPGNEKYPADIGKTSDKEGAWRVAAYISPGNRPRVREGQLIGRAGNSGNSGGPHLHMSIQPVTGTDGNGREALGASMPWRFRHMWAHRFEAGQQHTSGGWYRLRGGNFAGDPACPEWKANAPECGFKTIHASPYLRRASASAGTVQHTATLFLSSNRAVTATVAQSDKSLVLIGWDLAGVNKINRKGTIGAGATKEVYLSEVASDFVLAAVRQQDDTLKMIAFQVTPTGGFVRKADFTAGKISALDMATTRGLDRKAVTAVRTQTGDLKLIVWDIAFSPGGNVSVERLGEASAGAVSAVAISRARNFDGVFVAVRDSNNELKIIPYVMSAGGRALVRRSSAFAGKIGPVLDVAPLAQGVAAAVQDSDGNLRMITWSAGSNGHIGARRDTLLAGEVSEIKLLTAPHGGSNLTSAVRGSDGRLYLIGWAVNDNGANLRRLGSSRAGTASRISADVVSRSYPGQDPRDMVLTSVRTGENSLRLITWDTNLVNP
jgi:hypothetical protein